VPPVSLPALLWKAVGDAGFDLALGADGEWERVGVSGVPGEVWVLPAGTGGLFAVAEGALLREFTPATWTEVPLPAAATGAVRCATPAELYHALRRLRVLLEQLPPAPQQRLARRLAALGGTEAEALVKQRVGQDLFREMLLEYWGGRCAVTGLAVPELLRASHAKPWKDSDDRERLDVYNGLLLAVHLDALFDQGLIAFDDDGCGVVSAGLPEEARRIVLPGGELKLCRVAEPHRPYLAFHRERVFRRGAPETDPTRT
jgi:putative restriction endonuclease